MISRELAINLGITLVFSIGLFVYFNSKVNTVANKVDSVFQILQQQQQLINNHNMEYSANETKENMGEFMKMEEVLETSNDLVEISEDDGDDSDDSDSDESNSGDSECSDDSGDDEEDKKTLTLIDDKNEVVEEVNIEPINLETNSLRNSIDEPVTIEPPQNMNISELLIKKSNEQQHENDSLDNESLDNDSLDDISSDIEDNEAEPQDKDEAEPQDKEKKPLDKLTVQELKFLAEKKNLKRYKSLTKPKLIELIEKAE
tara:strand:+ start:18 stop:794 length:777 start_codon:yes stop_codon:yes gene_type:complete